MSTKGEFWPDTGPPSGDTATYGPSPLAALTNGGASSSPGASPVRTSARPDGLAAGSSVSTAGDPASGPSSSGSFASYDPGSSLWKTLPPSLWADWDEFSGTWPRSGLMRSGIACRLPPLVPHISGIGCSYLPTPTASGFGVKDVPRLLARRAAAKVRHGNGTGFGLTLQQWLAVLAHSAGLPIGQPNPGWVEWLMGFPAGWTDLPPSEMP